MTYNDEANTSTAIKRWLAVKNEEKSSSTNSPPCILVRNISHYTFSIAKTV